LAVGYVEQSFDAMVSDYVNDLKFKNNTDHPIFIKGYVTDDEVDFSFFGEENKLKFVRESVVLSEIEPEISRVYNKNLPKGEERVIVRAKKGYRSEGYLSVYDGDKLLSREKIREDIYWAVDGITEVGGDGGKS
jgi:vancomycin resistance protein YoaR